MRYGYASLLALLTACGSVELPVERYYRLQPSQVHEPDPMRAGVLRVHDLQLGTALDSDRLMYQSGVRLEPRPLSRWVAPLDRLVTDAMVLGLSRARVCELVKGSADAGVETWSLHGRIIDFVEAVTDDGTSANVAIELWLTHGEQIVFHDEFRCTEKIADQGPEQAVEALSRGLNKIVGSVVTKMRAKDLFAAAHRGKSVRGGDAELAEPPR